MFRAAFDLCRRHRIDMNILYDHSPSLFTDEVWEEFIQQIKNIDHLNLFLSNLRYVGDVRSWQFILFRDEDVTISMYHQGAEQKKEGAEKVEGKTNSICLKVRQILDKDPARYIQPILTTYVKLSPPDVESALIRIRDLGGMHPYHIHSLTIIR